jgi:hypothetical protein
MEAKTSVPTYKLFNQTFDGETVRVTLVSGEVRSAICIALSSYGVLLLDGARTLFVPWHRVAEMERRAP